MQKKAKVTALFEPCAELNEAYTPLEEPQQFNQAVRWKQNGAEVILSDEPLQVSAKTRIRRGRF